jgi:hypothetical protein
MSKLPLIVNNVQRTIAIMYHYLDKLCLVPPLVLSIEFQISPTLSNHAFCSVGKNVAWRGPKSLRLPLYPPLT